jgi:ankyrin repeat protein
VLLSLTPSHANIAAIKALVMNGADIDGRDKHLRTALHRAAQFGHTNAVRLLINLGADVQAKDENGWTPYDRAEKHPEI